jgi:hypothetical protein
MKIVYLILAIGWLALVYYQAKLITGKKVKELTGSEFGLGIALSLFLLYNGRPRMGFWDLNDRELRKWLDSMDKELPKADALKLAKGLAKDVRGKRKAEVIKLVEDAEKGLRDVYDTAKEVIQIIREQVVQGHNVMYSFAVGAVYCLIPVVIVGWLAGRLFAK